ERGPERGAGLVEPVDRLRAGERGGRQQRYGGGEVDRRAGGGDQRVAEPAAQPVLFDRDRPARQRDAAHDQEEQRQQQRQHRVPVPARVQPQVALAGDRVVPTPVGNQRVG